jgi:hypothetical protein
MGWFNKKEEIRKEPAKMGVPDFPRLPELPELPPLTSPKMKETLPQLPSFPTNSFGEKFSQTTIKDAISGKPDYKIDAYPEMKKGDKSFNANDFAPPKQSMQMMQKPLNKQREFEYKTKEIESEEDFEDFEVEGMTEETEEPEEFKEKDYWKNDGEKEELEEPKFDYKPEYKGSKLKKKEPVFIRIDKFEESMKAFEKAKKEVLEIERVLKDIMKVKEEEEKQLETWSKDIVRVKEQIDKVDKDIFSKLE